MTTFPDSACLMKGGIVLLDPDTSAVVRIIVLQYSSDSLIRTLQVKGVPADGGDCSEAFRFKGPAVESSKLDAEIHARKGWDP